MAEVTPTENPEVEARRLSKEEVAWIHQYVHGAIPTAEDRDPHDVLVELLDSHYALTALLSKDEQRERLLLKMLDNNGLLIPAMRALAALRSDGEAE